MRVVRMVRPKYIILENVAAILNNGLDIVLGELSEAGYDAEWAVISASSLGACHQRSRRFCVAINREFAYPKSRLSYGSKLESSFNKKSSTSKSRNSNISIAYPNSDGHQGRCTETRNKTTPGQDSQIIGSTNTSEFERCNNDGKDQRKSRIDESLSRSSDGGKTTSTETGRICELSQESNNDQRTGSQDKYQENKDRTLVSEGQSRVQLPKHKELGGDKTTFEDNSIRYGDDNDSKQGMDNQRSNVTNSDSNGSSPTERLRINGKTNTSSQEGENEVSKFKRGSESKNSGIVQQTAKWTNTKNRLNPNWRGYISKPTLRRGDDGLSNRVARIRALGNSIVPCVAAVPLQRIKYLSEKKC